ncbi:MAG: beta-N-acetylhexosaminidase [Puia sp.]
MVPFLQCLRNKRIYLLMIFFGVLFSPIIFGQQTALSKAGLDVIPYPKEVRIGGNNFVFPENVSIITDPDASAGDQFTAKLLQQGFQEKWRLSATVSKSGSGPSVRLTRKPGAKPFPEEGYLVSVSGNQVLVQAGTEAGLFYGVQTLLQLIKIKSGTPAIRGMDLRDWPDTKIRAVHYDTKHHQDKAEYVEELIRTLAAYKINMLIWEWEDKFAYPSHPEIGAPGAFTLQEMQAFTRYAKQYHIQIVPLVQGLGHASYILKWPQYAGLREIPASNFEFCPFKEGSYRLLLDLWKDAISATPGSESIHIGSDETFELGACPVCKKQMEEKGASWLYHRFVDSSTAMIQALGRRVMVWERPMYWKKGMKPNAPVNPPKGLILTEDYNYETPDLKFAKEAQALGYPVYAYDPNPGIEPLFLPYFFRKKDGKEVISGSLENSYRFLTSRMGREVYDGVIRTSWDDSGVPTQGWMLSFVTTAAFSWNASNPGLPEFTQSFFRNYYGNQEKSLDSLFLLLNEGAYFYYETLERQVWHFGSIGKTYLPDLPRGDALEYDPYWNLKYADMIKKAAEFKTKMQSAIQICKNNLDLPVQHAHELELFETIAELIQHTAQLYLDLSSLENAIRKAHVSRFLNYDTTYMALLAAQEIVESGIAERKRVYDHLVQVWEQTRLPKGMSTPEKHYFFRQDITRHFANRTADMRFLVIDEDDLDLEGYLIKLKVYTRDFKETFLAPGGENTRNEWPSPGYRNVNASDSGQDAKQTDSK